MATSTPPRPSASRACFPDPPRPAESYACGRRAPRTISSLAFVVGRRRRASGGRLVVDLDATRETRGLFSFHNARRGHHHRPHLSHLGGRRRGGLGGGARGRLGRLGGGGARGGGVGAPPLAKVLFLDVDGVLNKSTKPRTQIELSLVDRLARVVLATGAQVGRSIRSSCFVVPLLAPVAGRSVRSCLSFLFSSGTFVSCVCVS